MGGGEGVSGVGMLSLCLAAGNMLAVLFLLLPWDISPHPTCSIPLAAVINHTVKDCVISNSVLIRHNWEGQGRV